jgi:hypothetical protein
VILYLRPLIEEAFYFPLIQGDVTVKLHLNYKLVSQHWGGDREESLPLTCSKKELQ